MSPVTDLRCIVTVGTGRGFIVADEYHYYVITAAHCLPDGLPPCYSASALEQRIYKNLLGRLGSEPEVCAECLFADPIADIAVLGSPDNQALSAEAEKYQALMSAARVLTVANTPERGSAWLLSLNCNWFHCIVSHFGGPLWIEEGTEDIVAGMSGSPIIVADGSAIGVICIGGNIASEPHGDSGPNPCLAHHLPGWLLSELIH